MIRKNETHIYMSHDQYQSSSRLPGSLWPASLPRQVLQIQSQRTLWKPIPDPGKTSLDFMKETQRYIRSIQDPELQGKSLVGMRYREVTFPEQEMLTTTRKWQAKKRVKPMRTGPAFTREKSNSVLESSNFLNYTQSKPSSTHRRSDYTVTRYMLVKPMSPRANLGFPSRTQAIPLHESPSFVNQKIETFLNRFDRKSARISLPGIALKSTN